jgi:hypothetical protein
MNWQALAAVAELVGALAVVVTLDRARGADRGVACQMDGRQTRRAGPVLVAALFLPRL